MALNTTAILTALEANILSYETAIGVLIAGGVEEYELRSGQSQQRVKRSDVQRLQTALDGMYARYYALSQRAGLVNPVIARPAW